MVKIELNKRYDAKYYTDELDELISDSINLFADFKTAKVSGFSNIVKMEIRETIILEHLFEKTNFKSVFNEIKSIYGSYSKYSRYSHTVLYSLLSDLGKSEKENTFSNFLIILSDYANSIKKKPIRKFTYYLPLRINFDLTSDELKEIKSLIGKATNINLVNLPKYIYKQVKSNKLKAFLRNRKYFLKITVCARDEFFPSKLVSRKANALVGILAFSTHFYKSKRFGYVEDFSLCGSIAEKYSLLVENKKIIYPEKSDWQNLECEISDGDITTISKPYWKIHNKYDGNYKVLISILKLLSKQNEKLKEITQDSLRLYLEAMEEKSLESSFLKFWIITERILGKNKGGEYLKKMVKKLLRDEYLKSLVDHLYKKRNSMVHEYRIDFITQLDRNLTKAISERAILFLIEPPAKIKNIEELHFLLENMSLSKKELIRKNELISKIIK